MFQRKNAKQHNHLSRIAAAFVLAVTLVFSCPPVSYAAEAWPEFDGGVQAEGAILMDADSGCVLYGKNIHSHYYPASITKLLTALLVIENCGMDEEVTFSHRAVYDVESGSSNAGYGEGDVITVREALYALLLASANEAANALAEHTAGSIEGFVDMMNERAKQIGCKDSHFANPSGLNDDGHYTSAYDYALICREAYRNDTLVQVDGTTYTTLPANTMNPEPFTIYAHHSMLKKSNSMYYDGIIGGKTGYTSKAGNTLVTCAKRDGLKLITVILNGHKTHYDDTKLLLDWGFSHFKSVPLSACSSLYTKELNKLDISGTGVKNADVLYIDDSGTITFPANADISDIQSEVIYETDRFAPEGAVAAIRYSFGGRKVGDAFLMKNMRISETDIVIGSRQETETEEEESLAVVDRAERYVKSMPPWLIILTGAAAAAVVAAIVLLIIRFAPFSRRRDRRPSSSRGRSRGKRR